MNDIEFKTLINSARAALIGTLQPYTQRAPEIHGAGYLKKKIEEQGDTLTATHEIRAYLEDDAPKAIIVRAEIGGYFDVIRGLLDSVGITHQNGLIRNNSTSPMLQAFVIPVDQPDLAEKFTQISQPREVDFIAPRALDLNNEAVTKATHITDPKLAAETLVRMAEQIRHAAEKLGVTNAYDLGLREAKRIDAENQSLNV